MSFDLELSKIRTKERLDQVHRDRRRAARIFVLMILVGTWILFLVVWWRLNQ